MSIIGYARVSSRGQSLEIQMDKLNHHGCDTIYSEKLTGTTADRPELKACLEYLRKGDILVITKIDRLARSTYHLTKIVNDLHEKGIDFVVTDQNIDTTTPTGKLTFNILASIAEFETEIRKERQLEGIAKAKDKGVKFGRKAKLTDEQIIELNQDRTSGMLIKDVMNKYKISKASVYRLLEKNNIHPQ
ncbi:MAG: recombinase family protein [gamma proteobacterium symbiont of Taylorina sp.]|nr:recombinase family protein [gamma proteobacterium symbiont of Taylorina sp.]